MPPNSRWNDAAKTGSGSRKFPDTQPLQNDGEAQGGEDATLAREATLLNAYRVSVAGLQIELLLGQLCLTKSFCAHWTICPVCSNANMASPEFGFCLTRVRILFAAFAGLNKLAEETLHLGAHHVFHD